MKFENNGPYYERKMTARQRWKRVNVSDSIADRCKNHFQSIPDGKKVPKSTYCWNPHSIKQCWNSLSKGLEYDSSLHPTGQCIECKLKSPNTNNSLPTENVFKKSCRVAFSAFELHGGLCTETTNTLKLTRCITATLGRSTKTSTLLMSLET